ncbi:MAG: phosphate acyltransferase PlsX [Thermoleophilia bacterium]|nr:phosphate acyltransferase PlsX [Thermoleophilia bacterium]
MSAAGPTVVALDAMGGDNAPHATVSGAAEAAGQDLRVLLVGDERVLAPMLEALPEQTRAHLELVHAPDKIDSSEDGARAVRAKPDSSVVMSCRLVREGRAAAAVSLGHTGAMMAAATLHMRRIPGVLRPGIAVVLPSAAGFIVLIDAGANADARPEHLAQFGVMGRVFAQDVLEIEHPTVGLLSIGEEAERGSELVIAAHNLMKGTAGFIGNVEGRDIPRGTASVVVTDGFTGNVALKLYESAAQFLLTEVRAAVTETVPGRIGGLLVKRSIRRMRKRLDPDAVGGAFLLGVQGLAVIGHGSSNPTAVANAIRVAAVGVRHDMVEQLAAELGTPAAAPSA